MIVTKILDNQIEKKHVFNYWFILIDASISLTIDNIKIYFKGFLDDFYKNFKEQNGKFKIHLSDIPKIRDISERAFDFIKPYFIVYFEDKDLNLIHFYDLFKVGVQILDLEVSQISWKSKSTKQKEDYFQSQLSNFFQKVLKKRFSFDAYLKSSKHSDCILFSKSRITYEEFIFIEYASDINIGKSDDTNATIFGHLNRISNEYFEENIDFFHSEIVSILSENSLKDYSKNVWFIYFEENLKSSIIHQILDNYFEKINIVLVDYDFIKDKHLIIHFKKYNEKKFQKETIY